MARIAAAPRPRALTETIPEHLRPYIARQDPSLYTPIDHASWRFILKIARAFFAKHAHQKYLDGLEETGISTERIPLVEEMDQKLRRFGWRAVPVSGFIPPAVFMEFQSLGILPIACEMRQLEHLQYTPAPDIVHEAAGHAPIIADPEYASYLRNYGEISRKAVFSKQDMAVYEAIRDLSDTKEDSRSTPAMIEAAQKRLDDAVAKVDHDSEATLMSRMNWWTVEYGLVGGLDRPKIYGAGLLSSVGESYHCLGESVRKIPLTLGCIDVGYDITRPQPQLFVTPDFETLNQVLDEFAGTMAFRRGGIEGLEKARKAGATTTVVLETGLQISGTLTEFRAPGGRDAAFLKYTGPVQLAWGDRELEGQGPAYHAQGFSTPLGPILGKGKTAAELTAGELEELGFRGRESGELLFESGIKLRGKLEKRLEKQGRNLILAFSDCSISLGSETLFKPEWGAFDLACGEKIVSVFGGAADRASFVRATGGDRERPPRQPKTNSTPENAELNGLYAQVRAIRERGGALDLAALEKVHGKLERAYPRDWLLRYELLELAAAAKPRPAWEAAVRSRLSEIARSSPEKAELISRGLELL